MRVVTLQSLDFSDVKNQDSKRKHLINCHRQVDMEKNATRVSDDVMADAVTNTSTAPSPPSIPTPRGFDLIPISKFSQRHPLLQSSVGQTPVSSTSTAELAAKVESDHHFIYCASQPSSTLLQFSPSPSNSTLFPKSICVSRIEEVVLQDATNNNELSQSQISVLSSDSNGENLYEPTISCSTTSIPDMTGEEISNDSKNPWPKLDSRFSTRSPPPMPPATPTLDSAPRFSNFLGRTKPDGTLVSLPIALPTPNVAAKPPQAQNPFIDLSSPIDGGFRITARYNLAGKSTNSEYNRDDSCQQDSGAALAAEILESSDAQVGPYRKAAVWEFVGQTFAKAERKGKPRHRKRFRCYASGVVPVPGTSHLSRPILTSEGQEEKVLQDRDVLEEWGKFMTGESDR